MGPLKTGVIRTRLSIRGSRWVLFGSAIRWCQNDWFMCGSRRLWLWDLRRFVWFNRVQQWRVHAAAAHRGGKLRIGVIEPQARPITATITVACSRPESSCSRVTALSTSKIAPSRWAMEAPEISESTPLLRLSSISIPCIRSVIDRLLAQSNTTPTADHILAQFPSHRDLIPSYRTAFVLITLLQIGCDARKQLAHDDSLNLWDTWDHHLNAELVSEHCASHVLEVWTNFVRVPRDSADLDALLWAVFPLGEDRCTGVCRKFLRFDPDPWKSPPFASVADFLQQSFGEGLLVHPLIISTVSRTWKHGRVVTLPLDASFSSRLYYRIRSLGTPRLVN